MGSRRRQASDSTAADAVADVAGHVLFVELRSRIEDERDRALVFARIGLGVSLAGLERQFGEPRAELSERIESILTQLREDEELVSILSGTHKAGRAEHFRALIMGLGIQEWFCAYCGEFMVQPETGRRRKTCSDTCRRKDWRRRQKGRAGIGGGAPRSLLPGTAASRDVAL